MPCFPSPASDPHAVYAAGHCIRQRVCSVVEWLEGLLTESPLLPGYWNVEPGEAVLELLRLLCMFRKAEARLLIHASYAHHANNFLVN